MADRPILFSAPMVRALLEGRKTQTRRIAKVQWLGGANPNFTGWHSEQVGPRAWGLFCTSKGADIAVPYAVGDLLWVRETYYQFGHWEPLTGYRTKGGKQKWAFVPHIPGGPVRFEPQERFRSAMRRDDPYTPAWHKRLGRFMPRSASRITLRLTAVKVERLQDISEADAIAEGVRRDSSAFMHAGWWVYDGEKLPSGEPANVTTKPIDSFASLWRSINGPDSWDANPWVAAITFRVITEHPAKGEK